MGGLWTAVAAATTTTTSPAVAHGNGGSSFWDSVAFWIAAVAAVVLLVFTVVLAVKTRKRRVVAYSTYVERPVFNAGPLAERVTVMLDDRALADPYLLLLTITNAGNEPVKKADFEESIRLTFENAEEVGYEIETDVKGLRPQINEHREGEVEIKPLLLNAGDGFTIYFLFDGAPEALNVEARIAGTQVRDVTGPSLGDRLVTQAVAAAADVSIGLPGLRIRIPVPWLRQELPEPMRRP